LAKVKTTTTNVTNNKPQQIQIEFENVVKIAEQVSKIAFRQKKAFCFHPFTQRLDVQPLEHPQIRKVLSLAVQQLLHYTSSLLFRH
jgi:hypothetical protein